MLYQLSYASVKTVCNRLFTGRKDARHIHGTELKISTALGPRQTAARC